MALDTRRVVYRSGFPINTPRLNGFVLSKEKKALVIMSISPDFDFNLTFLLSEVMKSRVP